MDKTVFVDSCSFLIHTDILFQDITVHTPSVCLVQAIDINAGDGWLWIEAKILGHFWQWLYTAVTTGDHQYSDF